MLRWICGGTKLARIGIGREIKLGYWEKYQQKVVQESRLKWYGQTMRREEEYV